MLNVLVVGGNRGLGLGIAKAFVGRGAQVLATCREPPSGVEIDGVTFVDGIDVTAARGLSRLTKAIGTDPVDILVCSAGLNLDGSGLGELEIENVRTMLDVNTLGVVRTVLAVLPSLSSGSKIAIVTSGDLSVLNIDRSDSSSSRFYGYKMSKAAVTSFGLGIGVELRDRGVAVLLASPGPVASDLLRKVVAEGRATPRTLDIAMKPDDAGEWFAEQISALTIEKSPMWISGSSGGPIDIDALANSFPSSMLRDER